MITMINTRTINTLHINDEYAVHVFMSSVLGYTPCPSITVYSGYDDQCVTNSPVITAWYGAFNADTLQDIARVFKLELPNGKVWAAKVVNGKVTEYYEAYGEIDGVPHATISYDAVTHEPTDYYDHQEGNLVKYDVATDTPGDVIVFMTPPDLTGIEHLIPTKVKRTLFAWCQKQSGLILEYWEK